MSYSRVVVVIDVCQSRAYEIMPEATVALGSACKYYECADNNALTLPATLRDRRPQHQQQQRSATTGANNRMTWSTSLDHDEAAMQNEFVCDDNEIMGGGGSIADGCGDLPNVSNDTWGFRITGGAEFCMPITVFHVSYAARSGFVCSRVFES